MTRCENCGRKLDPTALFCGQCQAPAPGHGKQCAHCYGAGICSRDRKKGWFRTRVGPCASCRTAALRPRTGSGVACSVCGGSGIVRTQ